MKMLKWLLVLFVLGLLLVGGLVALMPAKFVVDRFADRLGPIRLEGVSGTVWRGQAAALGYGEQRLGALRWSVHPLALLSRRLDVDLVLEGGEFSGETFASVGAARIQLQRARLAMDAQKLQPALDIPALELRGRVDLAIAEAELVAGIPRQLRGEAHWRNAAVAGAAEALLGDLRAEFMTATDGAIIGTVEDLGGPLALDGQFRAALTGYEATAVLAARDGNPQVVEALRYVGELQPDGTSLLVIGGRFLPLP